MNTQPQYTFAIKNASGQVCATVTCSTARQAYANATLVIRNMVERERLELMPQVFYAEPVILRH